MSKRRKRRRSRLGPKRDVLDRLTRELQRSKVRPETVEQAAVAFRIISKQEP
jgi:hypothetical protein